MFKARIKKENRALLLELLKLMAEVDGNVSTEEMEMILQIKKVYNMKNYQYQNLTKDEIKKELSLLDEETVLNILTHTVLLALGDKNFDLKEQSLFKEYFDLLSLENATKMQQMINRYGEEGFDVRDLYNTKITEEDIVLDSLDMMDEFASGNPEDVDEKKLFKMNKGALKKVWDQVLGLNNVIRDPKSDKVAKSIAIGALLYVLFPLDVVNDLIPVLGLTDDVAVVTYAVSQLSKNSNINWKAFLKK